MYRSLLEGGVMTIIELETLLAQMSPGYVPGSFDPEFVTYYDRCGQILAAFRELREERDDLQRKLSGMTEGALGAVGAVAQVEANEIATLREERDALRKDVEAQEKSTELHANINRDVSEALGQEPCATWHDLGVKVNALREERDALRACLSSVKEYIEQLPSGIDEEADPNDPSPDDASAHIGGLIWQEITAVLERFEKLED